MKRNFRLRSSYLILTLRNRNDRQPLFSETLRPDQDTFKNRSDGIVRPAVRDGLRGKGMQFLCANTLIPLSNQHSKLDIYPTG
jgi:hypothetical protein